MSGVVVKVTENKLIVTKEDKKVTVAAPYVKNENNYMARLVILGYYDTLSDLTTAVTSPSEGDPYGVGTEAPYTIYIWNGTEWKDNGTLKGEKGDPTEWIRGTVDPTTEGIDGDLYLNYTTWHVWEKISGTWEDKGTIKGADGADGAEFQEVAEKDQPGGYAGLDENGKVANAIQADKVGEKLAADVVIKNDLNAPGDAPMYVCRAWVSFDGTTTSPTIRASGNVSSITKKEVGKYTINFDIGMIDGNFIVSFISGGYMHAIGALTTSSVDVLVKNAKGVDADSSGCRVAIFR